MFKSAINTINSLDYVGIALLMALENIIPLIPSDLHSKTVSTLLGATHIKQFAILQKKVHFKLKKYH